MFYVGTCVNVGCIPKKLFHYAGLLGESKHDLKEAGWGIDTSAKNSWAEVSEKIQNYIRSLNFGYRKKLNTEKIKYYNKLAKMVSKHEVELTGLDNKPEIIKAKYILIATGGRPSDPGIPGGKEHAISSDDIFWKT